MDDQLDERGIDSVANPPFFVAASFKQNIAFRYTNAIYEEYFHVPVQIGTVSLLLCIHMFRLLCRLINFSPQKAAATGDLAIFGAGVIMLIQLWARKECIFYLF